MLQYRAEIDGLRALAVVPVMLFHAGFSAFSGGFVGVDIFFVISGYLITSIIIAELKEGRFSITRFYERRARRILPALFFVMLCCMPFAWAWMLPDQVKAFGQALVAVTLFSSNILFWQRQNYFSETGDMNPLLHTWSLAVEEQFYIIFPIFLIYCWRMGRVNTLIITVVFLLLSMILAQWASVYDSQANFYLSPTRFWELLVGSCCAFIAVDCAAWKRQTLSLIGLGLIAFSIFYFDSSTPFPSVYTVVPVAGAALIILFASSETLSARLLAASPMVGIGLISYSTYLVHQPLLAFLRIRSVDHPPQWMLLGAVILSIVLGALIWRFVEQPFRSRPGRALPSRTGIFVGSGVTATFMIGLGLWAHMAEGFPARMPEIVAAGLRLEGQASRGCPDKLDAQQISTGNRCYIGRAGVLPSVAIVGDSHVSALQQPLGHELDRAGFSAEIFSGPWCAPLFYFTTNLSIRGKCASKMDASLSGIVNSDRISVVILHAEWSAYTNGWRWGDRDLAAYDFAEPGSTKERNEDARINASEFNNSLIYTIKKLIESGKQVVLVLPVPEYQFNVRNAVAANLLFRDETYLDRMSIPVEQYLERNMDSRKSLISVAKNFHIETIDPMTIFCALECRPFDGRNRPLYIDGNHLNFEGGKLLARDIVRTLIDASTAPTH